jgi:hypothetical protein
MEHHLMAYLPQKTVGITDGPNLDPFSRLRVSVPNLIFSVPFDTADRILYWDGTTATGGTATFSATNSTFALAVTTTSGSRVVRQTREYFPYRAAQGQLALMTFTLGAAKTNLTQRVGYFDDLEGLYLEQDGTTVAVKIKSNITGAATYESATQTTWNLDRMDGNGGSANPSGMTLDLTETQILVLDFQWLGVGRGRFGFDIGGGIVYVHEFLHANTANGNTGLPYMRTPKLPMRYEILNTGTTASISSMTQICSAIVREGAADAPGPTRTIFTNPNNSATTTTTLRSILGVRLGSANIRASLGMLESALVNDSTGHLTYMLVMNPTWVTGSPTWVDVPGADAITEMSRTQLAVVVSATAGVEGMPTGANSLVVDGGVTTGGGNNFRGAVQMRVEDTLRAVANYAGTPDEVWVCARVHTGTGNVIAALSFAEIR